MNRTRPVPTQDPIPTTDPTTAQREINQLITTAQAKVSPSEPPGLALDQAADQLGMTIIPPDPDVVPAPGTYSVEKDGTTWCVHVPTNGGAWTSLPDLC